MYYYVENDYKQGPLTLNKLIIYGFNVYNKFLLLSFLNLYHNYTFLSLFKARFDWLNIIIPVLDKIINIINYTLLSKMPHLCLLFLEYSSSCSQVDNQV